MAAGRAVRELEGEAVCADSEPETEVRVILGPDGKPAQPLVSFITFEWMTREMVERNRADAIAARVMDLRDSVLGDEPSGLESPVVHVKLPPRFVT
jgi:hypothetical protein